MQQYLRNAPTRCLIYGKSAVFKLGLVALVVIGLMACTQAVYAETFAINASVNNPAGGTISPSGVVNVNAGDSQTFTATPATGFYVSYFQVDGVPATEKGVTSYTFTDIQQNHGIVAVFSNTYTITASVEGTGGTISPAGKTPVNYGGSLAVNIIPASGKQVTDVLVDGASVGAVTLYTFNNVTADHTIVAKFATGTHTLTLLFDQSAYRGDVWIQVQDKPQTIQATYGNGQSITFKETDDMMSNPVKLSDIGAGGLKVNYANSVNLFVFYDDPTKNDRKAAPPHMISQQRFMPFELTMTGGAGDGGDLTAINYFSAPLSIRSYSVDPAQYPNILPLQQASFGGASAAAIAAPLIGGCKSNPTALVKNAQGAIIRVLGPSNNFTPAANPWPSFVPYTQSIHAATQTTKIQNTNSFFFSYTGFETPVYKFGTDNMIATANADGSLSITGRITVSVQGTIKKGTYGNPDPPASGYWDGATFTFGVSDVNAFNDAIYREVRNSAVTFTNETDPTSAWYKFKQFTQGTLMDPTKPHQNDSSQPNYNPSLYDLFANGKGGDAYNTTLNLFIGEVTTGLLGGFFNSNYQVGGTAIKTMPSYQWWKLDPMVAFSTIQPSHPYYSLYSGVIYDLSKNTVYGTPYSDRFGKVLINSVNYETIEGVRYYVNYWKIGIGAPLPQAIVVTRNTAAVVG